MAYLNGCWFVAGSSGTADFSDGTGLSGYRNLSDAGAANGATYSYRAKHPTDDSIWEIGQGAYSSSGGTLGRTVIASSTGSKINFAVAPIVSLEPTKEDLDALAPKANPTFTGTVSGITKAMVGLSAVTNDAQLKIASNLSDLASISSARQNLVVSVYCANRTALKAIDTTKDAVALLLEAGREGMFVWRSGDYSSQITADTQEGIYVKATAIASSSGAWVRSFFGPVDPRWYGATGDGSTDDTTAVQAAIDSGADAVRIPADCTFIIGAAGLTGVSNQQIVGDNRYSSILKLGSTPTADFIAYSSKLKFALRNLTVDWNNKTPAGNNASIFATSCDNFEIKGCEIINVSKFGIMLNGARNFRIDDNHIEKNTAATSQNQAINVSVAARTSFNGRISGNVLERTAIDFAGFNSEISRNRISNWKFGAGITTEQSGDCNKLTIVGNIIDSGTGTDANSYVCGGIENWAPWSIIGENIIFSNAGAGIDQGGQHCHIIGNVCFNNGVTNNGPGISARYADSTYNGNYSAYSNNVCFDTNTTSGTQGYGYSEQSSSLFGSMLTGNVFDGNKTGNVSILSSTTGFIGRTLTGTATYDPANLTNGSGATTDVTVAGARLGDIAKVSFSLDLQGIKMFGWVNASNNVKVRFENHTGGAINLASGTITVAVEKTISSASL
jgi:hypothetical protein